MSGRRSFLASAAATMVAAGVTVPVAAAQAGDQRGAAYGAPLGHPDAALMGWCAALIAMEADWRRRLDADEDADRPAAYHSTLAAITGTAAVTIEGNRAKLAAAASFYDPDPPGTAIVGRAMWDAIRGLALPALPTPIVVHDPDAELLALCATFAAVQAEQEAWNASPVDDDDYSDELGDRWHGALEKLSAMPARTLPGFRAKAHAVRAAMLTSTLADDWGTEEKAALVVLADLAGLP